MAKKKNICIFCPLLTQCLIQHTAEEQICRANLQSTTVSTIWNCYPPITPSTDAPSNRQLARCIFPLIFHISLVARHNTRWLLVCYGIRWEVFRAANVRRLCLPLWWMASLIGPELRTGVSQEKDDRWAQLLKISTLWPDHEDINHSTTKQHWGRMADFSY